MGGEERREYIYNGLVAGALRDGNSHDEAIAYANENIDDYAPVPWCGYVDWDDIMFKKGNHQTYEASISGGTDKFKYYSSISYLKQEGIAILLSIHHVTLLSPQTHHTMKMEAGTAILSATVIVIHYYLQLTTINVNMLIVLSTLFMANMNLLKT